MINMNILDLLNENHDKIIDNLKNKNIFINHNEVDCLFELSCEDCPLGGSGEEALNICAMKDFDKFFINWLTIKNPEFFL